MKLFTTLSLSLILCSSLSAQEWVRQHPNAIIGQMYDVEMSTNGFGVAAGAEGFLMTADFGENWGELDLGINSFSVTHLALIPDGTQNAMLIYSNGHVWRTTDAGAAWEEIAFDEGPYMSPRW